MDSHHLRILVREAIVEWDRPDWNPLRMNERFNALKDELQRTDDAQYRSDGQ